MEKQESKKEVEEKSTAQENSTEEKKDNLLEEEEPSQKNEEGEEQEQDEDEWTPPSREEWEKTQKKAKDFDGIIEKQRLEKLAKKEKKEDNSVELEKDENSNSTLSEEELEAIVERKLAEKERERNYESYKNNLAEAYRQFIKDNPWADNDDVISSISKNFNPGRALSKEQLLAKINNVVSETFPQEYIKSQEERIKSKILLEEKNIDSGEGGGFSVKKNVDNAKRATKEDQRIADKYFGGDIERYLKYKQEN